MTGCGGRIGIVQVSHAVGQEFESQPSQTITNNVDTYRSIATKPDAHH